MVPRTSFGLGQKRAPADLQGSGLVSRDPRCCAMALVFVLETVMGRRGAESATPKHASGIRIILC